VPFFYTVPVMTILTTYPKFTSIAFIDFSYFKSTQTDQFKFI
jgi:hypothetical protein